MHAVLLLLCHAASHSATLGAGLFQCCSAGVDVIVAGVYAVLSLNGRYPQVTLVDSSLASGSSSHTTVVAQDVLVDQSPVTSSLCHQTRTCVSCHTLV